MANADTARVVADNTKAIEGAIDKALVAGLEACGLIAEGAAKRLCPVDTGRLRNSITHLVAEGEGAVYVGTNVEYAPYVELREDLSHTTGQAHFLRDAATGNADRFRKAMESALKNG